MKRIKQLMMLLAIVAGGSLAYGQSGTCGSNMTWEYNPSTTTLTISGTGQMTSFSNADAVPWKDYKTAITSIVLQDGITTIDRYAFRHCTNLQSVTLPEALTAIAIGTFYNCSSLTSITIPSGVTGIQSNAFEGTGLTDVTVHWTSSLAAASGAFSGLTLSNINLHVPYGTKTVYEAASPWSSFNIVEMNPSGQCGDNLFWEYNPSTYTLTITGTGDMWDWYDAPDVPWQSFKPAITTVVLPNGLTTIGELAFYACYELTSITIPAGVTTIGNGAFYSCLMLTSVTIPEGVTTIDRLAFADCQALTSIEIPATVTTIGVIAFATGDNLASVTVNWTDLSGVTTAANAFSDIASGATLHVPCGTKSAYEATEPWSSFTIDDPCPSGQCGDNLYWLYNSDTHVLTITGTGDMWDYSGTAPAPWHDYRTEITTVILPNELTGIGSYAFYNCSGLTSVTIGNSVTSIGDYAFEGCSGLTNVILPSSLQSIGNNAFRNCKILTSIDIPSNVTSIGQYAFNGCKALESVTIPEGVTAINSATFLGCIGLTSINLPSHLTSIGSSAFKNCSTLTSITLPISVTAISTHSFDRCTGLTDMYVSWETNITGVGSLVFDGVTLANIRLHVPCGTKSAYAAASVWQDFNIVDPCEGHYPITAKADPNDASTYYSTFYYGTAKYLVPEDVEAYAASVNGSDLVLTKIADAGEVLPAETAVILKSTIGSYTMVPSTDAAITNTAGNQLQGVDEPKTAPSNCYVLSGPNPSNPDITEVGFYLFSGTLGAHKAYIVLPSGSGAPKRLRFVFDSTQDIEEPTSDSSLKGGEKILLDGVLYIERGEHLYNAQGVRVK